MPEAAMNEDDATSARQNEVRSSGQRSNMKPITVAKGVQQPPNYKLRFRVPAPNTSHECA